MPWKLFEESVFKYFTENITIEDVNFAYLGKSDSTKGDIEVNFRNTQIFNIECKESESQSSQFVLEIDRKNEIFFFSKKNKSSPSNANQIINHMNNNFNYYAGFKKSKNLNNKLLCEKEFLYKFVIKNISNNTNISNIDNLISKGSRFIATSKNRKEPYNQENIIFFPTSELENYFDLVGTYRTKQSGSRIPSKKDLITFPYETLEIEEFKKKRFYVNDINSEIPDRIGDKFFLQKVNSFGRRELRIRGKTKNHNVIFSLKLKKNLKNNICDNYIKKLISQEIQKII